MTDMPESTAVAVIEKVAEGAADPEQTPSPAMSGGFAQGLKAGLAGAAARGLRMQCLELAAKSAEFHTAAGDVLGRAQAYAAFVLGADAE